MGIIIAAETTKSAIYLHNLHLSKFDQSCIILTKSIFPLSFGVPANFLVWTKDVEVFETDDLIEGVVLFDPQVKEVLGVAVEVHRAKLIKAVVIIGKTELSIAIGCS